MYFLFKNYIGTQLYRPVIPIHVLLRSYNTQLSEQLFIQPYKETWI